jgi:hypothetical protein
VKTISPSNAADCPADYLDQLYLELPRLFAIGGTEDDVVTVFGAVGTALEGALEVPHGRSLELRMFPLPYGWAPDYEPKRTAAFDRAAVAADLSDPDPEFRFGDWTGLLFVPAPATGGWQRWNPARGPAPKPKDGHMLVTLVLLRAGSAEATVCQMREVFGNDKSLRRPLYKPAMKLSPASPTESAHLVGTLRSLLATDEES